jgi:signal peptidase I
MKTSTYPLAIVQGTSMWPKLQNGDVVIFQKPQQQNIANGSVIVFVQGESGVTALDTFTRPILVHRIINTIVQADGAVYYRTKGDNNQLEDPALVQADHVLGIQAYTVPKVGFLALFVESPQGLIAVIGMVSLFYIGKTDVEMKNEKLKELLCGKLSELALRGDLTMDLYTKLEAATKYSDSIRPESIDDSRVLELLYWIKGGALEEGWKMFKVNCPICGKNANRFESSKGSTYTICSNCDEIDKHVRSRKPILGMSHDASNRSHMYGIGYSPSISRKKETRD